MPSNLAYLPADSPNPDSGAMPVPQDKDVMTPPPLAMPAEQKPIGAGYSGGLGAAASIAGDVLRGWMTGKYMKDLQTQRQAVQQVGAANAVWESSQKYLSSLVHSGKDENDPEVQQAKTAAAKAWQDRITVMEQYAAPTGKKSAGTKIKNAVMPMNPEMFPQVSLALMKGMNGGDVAMASSRMTPAEQVVGEQAKQAKLRTSAEQMVSDTQKDIRAVTVQQADLQDQLRNETDPAKRKSISDQLYANDQKLARYTNQAQLIKSPDQHEAEQQTARLAVQVNDIKSAGLKKLDSVQGDISQALQPNGPDGKPNPNQLSAAERISLGIGSPNDPFQAYVQLYGNSQLAIDKYYEAQTKMMTTSWMARGQAGLLEDIKGTLRQSMPGADEATISRMAMEQYDKFRQRVGGGQASTAAPGGVKPLTATARATALNTAISAVIADPEEAKRFAPFIKNFGTASTGLVLGVNPSPSSPWLFGRGDFQQNRSVFESKLAQQILDQAKAAGYDDRQAQVVLAQIAPDLAASRALSSVVANNPPGSTSGQGAQFTGTMPTGTTVAQYRLTAPDGTVQIRALSPQQLQSLISNPSLRGGKIEPMPTATAPRPSAGKTTISAPPAMAH